MPLERSTDWLWALLVNNQQSLCDEKLSVVRPSFIRPSVRPSVNCLGVGALTQTNISWNFWNSLITKKYRSSSNLGGIGYARRGLSAREFIEDTHVGCVGALTRTTTYGLLLLNFGNSKFTWKYVSSSISGEISSWEVGYLPLNWLKIPILRVFVALTRTNIYWSLWNFGNCKFTWKYKSSFNYGEMESRGVGYLPLNM